MATLFLILSLLGLWGAPFTNSPTPDPFGVGNLPPACSTIRC